MNHNLLGAITIIISLASYLPYLRSINQGKIKPHAFSWLLWSLLTFISFAAQFSAGSGPGSWASVVGAFMTLAVGLSCLKYGDADITRSDWIVLTCGLSAIPVWIATKDPLWSIIIVSIIDAFGYIPTMRKSWLRPHQEDPFRFGLSGINKMLQIAAINTFSVTTWLSPATVVVFNTLLVVLILYRRSVLGKNIVHAS